MQVTWNFSGSLLDIWREKIPQETPQPNTADFSCKQTSAKTKIYLPQKIINYINFIAANDFILIFGEKNKTKPQ